jgi:hypothetical protein
MKKFRSNQFVLISFLSVAAWLPIISSAAPAAKLWPFWLAANEKSQLVFDFSPWQKLLDQYLVERPTGINLFRYGAVSPADKKRLTDYLAQQTRLDPRQYSRAEQKAYWINLYNALTVKLILDNYPVKSITKLGGWFSFGPWDQKLVTIAGQKVSLNDIEHRILRPIWKDNRIHYAVNCASISCPNLAAQAYTAKTMNALLDQAARNYINSPRGVEFKAGQLWLSSIYDWYAVDFGGTREGVLDHLQHYARPKLKEQLRSYQGNFKYHYNWDLNQTG